LRARTIHDIFSLFIGLGFLVSAIIDLMHAIISFYAISDPIFIKYFIPQTWFAGRIFLSSLLSIAIIKYSKISKGIDERYQSGDEFQEQNLRNRDQRKVIFYLVGLGIFSFGIALTSLYFIFPASVIDEYSLHRPYEIPPLILFSIALFFFYKQKLYKKKDLLYKGLVIYLILDIFSQIIMSYSTISFDTAHNIAHVLKDAAYFVNIIALSLSSIQINVELRKSNRLVILQNKKLEETGKMQKEFINIAAHELRTPIQPILGLSGLLINHNTKGSENHKIAEVIYRNALKLQHIAEDILDVTKIESQSLSLNKEKFDLDELISNTISDFENLSNYKTENLSESVKIIYKSKGQSNKHNPIIVEADKMRISQVISNILSNASKSNICTETRNIKFIYVDIERQQNEREKVLHKRIYNQNINENKNKKTYAIVSIKDEGIGIKQELRSRLYEKFTTDSQGGTGLGLFICKNIIESHGGDLWFEDNKDGKGVTFYFTLPMFDEISKERFQDSISSIAESKPR
jgi:signal transduction histidine kinase